MMMMKRVGYRGSWRDDARGGRVHPQGVDGPPTSPHFRMRQSSPVGKRVRRAEGGSLQRVVEVAQGRPVRGQDRHGAGGLPDEGGVLGVEWEV